VETVATVCLVNIVDHTVDQLTDVRTQGFPTVGTFTVEVLASSHVASSTVCF
jgi:hypothetical protein